MSKKYKEHQIVIDLSQFSPYAGIKWFFKFILAVIVPPLHFLEKIGVHRRPIVLGLGLGIGVVASILITQRPDILQAFPSSSLTSGSSVQVTAIAVKKIDWYAKVAVADVADALLGRISEPIVQDARSGGLGAGRVVLLDNPMAGVGKKLERLTLSDEITVFGNNGASYRYSIIEIREIQAEYLPHVLNMHQEALYIYSARNPLRTQLLILVAKQI